MTNVVRLPQERMRRPLHEQALSWRDRPKAPWADSMGFADLQGARPLGHPHWLNHGSRGEVTLEIGQVWVENGTTLWAIKGIAPLVYEGQTRTKVVVYVSPYNPALQDRPVIYVLLASSLRRSLKVWEEEVQDREESYQEWMNGRGLEP